MQVLTLTPFYPAASDDAAGCFAAEPLPALHEFGVTSSVLAVQPFYRRHMEPNPGAHPAEWVHYTCLPGGLGLPSAGSMLYATLLPRVRKIHHDRRVDLIHAHAALPCGHAAALLGRRLNIPWVVTVHGLDTFFTHQVRGYAGQLCERWSRWVYESASRVICISQKVAAQLTRGASSSVQTIVLYNGVNTDLFTPYSSPSVENVILSVGNLIPSKGHENVIRSFAKLLPQFPGSRCEIIGDGPERRRLAWLAYELGIGSQVRFLGRRSRSQVAEAMRNCTIFALPSRYEGLGCVYLEAMSSGKPVIACKGQGIDEIILHQKNGWLIEPNDELGLKDAMSLLLGRRDLQAQIGAEARRTILQSHSLSHQAARLAQVYRECAA
jgi:glycosyltransferase involved in cell wall biosynthesis